MILPRTIVMQLINKYEDLDISLIIDDSYRSKKRALLNKKIIRKVDFYKFIEETKTSTYTNFIILPYLTLNSLISIPSKRYSISFYNDIKFKKILYMKFTAFTMDNYISVEEVISKTVCDEIIFDLRDNGGGILNACLKMLDLFLPEKEYLKLITKTGTQVITSSSPYRMFSKIYIFLNENTASCSEIFSLALRKYLDNVFLIGEKTTSKDCTQHSIKNKLYGYIFTIEDSKWLVGNESAESLSNYMKIDSGKRSYLNESDYLKQVLLIRNNGYENTLDSSLMC
ncbi:hypothetical protein acsn021_02980 [Anaerocolumna cellulosilytica]|uniref:Uncharacterized protein n=1 Tax=Anaerocolumna cellulosilytica TaxID=433286 RepID=A0A6S6QUH7_9FIRM|nr:S41 family peptidase [Anaerocolumna cellulosilytica]MBB5196870.1 carboxyl-terminal processing protease [Anaerocolumna cellulosilytica]BCJ92729.1 hypothetical protein acsn021_02980 [Anaerocolumna cellulosilytica]